MKKFIQHTKFTKYNHTDFNDALIKESNGLKELHKTLQAHQINIKIPDVFQVDEESMTLERIQATQANTQQWQDLGRNLAQLHLIEQSTYGFHEHNYIGLNPQPNHRNQHWADFFLQQRLQFQIQRIQQQSIREQFTNDLHAISENLMQFLDDNCAFPSLLHGDLWSGNVMFDNSDVWLIDPAVYCGDADADVAMTELFGGFPTAFYEAYFAIKAKSQNHAVKRTIYNLYHQLNHYNLFGSSYLHSCQSALTKLNKTFM